MWWAIERPCTASAKYLYKLLSSCVNILLPTDCALHPFGSSNVARMPRTIPLPGTTCTIFDKSTKSVLWEFQDSAEVVKESANGVKALKVCVPVHSVVNGLKRRAYPSLTNEQALAYLSQHTGKTTDGEHIRYQVQLFGSTPFVTSYLTYDPEKQKRWEERADRRQHKRACIETAAAPTEAQAKAESSASASATAKAPNDTSLSCPHCGMELRACIWLESGEEW